jgi:hypothetical protein
MNEIQCLAVAVLLFKRILERVREKGHLTVEEKTQIFKTIRILSFRMLHSFGQFGELCGQIEMPRVKHRYLEDKRADSDDE